MKQISLISCLFCKVDCIEVLAVELDMYAAVCRACGAHGPVRVLGPKQLVEHVKAQAAHDWNQAATTKEPSANPAVLLAGFLKRLGYQLDDEKTWSVIKWIDSPPEYTEGPATASPVEGQAGPEPGEAVSTEAPGTLQPPGEGDSVEQSSNKAAGDPRKEDRKPDNGGEAVTESNETNGTGKAAPLQPEKPVLDKPVPSQAIAPLPAGDGGAGDSLQARVTERLTRFLGSIGMCSDTAVNKGMKFGVSKATLYNITKGKKITNKTLRVLDKNLARMERGQKLSGANADKPAANIKHQADYDESLVEKLPNKFKPITGNNRCPGPKAPPRCDRAS